MALTTTRLGIPRAVVIGVAMSGVLTLGAAAATAIGVAPWSPPPPGEHQGAATEAIQETTSDPSTTEPAATRDTAALEDTIPSDTSAPTEPSSSDPVTTDPTDPAPTDPVPTDPVPTDPVPTDPVPTDPPATDPSATDPSEPPTTTDEGKVPLGISLHCTVAHTTVSCHWSGGVVAGFARYLVLRGDGGPSGRVPFTSDDPASDHAIDTGLAPGSYSYVVITVDADSRPLTHSNPVYVQIAAPD